MKFIGKLGYVMSVESRPGVYSNQTVEKSARGDLLSANYRQDYGGDVISDITLESKISIVMNRYIEENLQYIKYVEYKDMKWSVKSALLQRPRIILTLGGLYNG